MATLLEHLNEALRTPMNVMKNGKATGETVEPMKAAVKSLVARAAIGEIPAVAFIVNLQRQQAKPDGDYSERQQQRVGEIAERLHKQLEGEGLYDQQDTEISNLAETQYLIEQLTATMHASDFAPVTTEYTSNGGTKTVANPVIALLDTQKDRFQKQLDKLRNDAMQRKINRRNFKD